MRRKRWVKTFLAGLLALGNATGCKQQIFMEPQDYQAAVLSGLPKGLETNAAEVIAPSIADTGKPPATVLDPDRPARFISLKECIAIALEQGNTGFQTPTALGSKLEILPSFNGASVSGTDSIRAFAIDPATQANELERSLSKFDVQWINSATWQKVDNPVAAQFLTFSSQYDTASISSTLLKPLPTGGVAAITFDTTYTKYAQPNTSIGNFVNPNYVPQVQLSFEQPLLRLFGVDANELSPSHPGSLLFNIQPSGGVNTQGILLQRIHVDQQKAQFEVMVNYMMANVELAYWNLFAAYYNLYANEEGLREAYLGYRFTDTRVLVGQDPSQNRDQARAQFERFRRQVIDARGTVLESERQLRGMLGLRSDDGTRLVPIDEPNLVPYLPNFHEAAQEAMAHRPEILQCRQDLKVQQLNLLLQKNLRRPDLRFISQYSVQGLGTRLDGSADLTQLVPGNALNQLAQDRYQNWTLGLRLTMPLGFRDANAMVREAQLSLARSYYQLKDTELKVNEYLVQQYRIVVQTHADIEPARAERQALQIYIAKIDTLISIGKWNPQDFLNYLTVQQQLATAIATEFQAIANYNNALATFEFAKGTIQQYNNVTIGEGPLPAWAQKKARDQFSARDASLKLLERPASEINTSAQLPVGPAVGTGFSQDLPPFATQNWSEIPKSVDQPTPPPMQPPVLTPGLGGIRASEMPGSQPLPTMPVVAPATATAPVQAMPPVTMPPRTGLNQPAAPIQPVTSTTSVPAVPANTEVHFVPVGTASIPSHGFPMTTSPSVATPVAPAPSQPSAPPAIVPAVPAPAAYAPTTSTPPAFRPSTGTAPPLPAGTGMAPLPIPAATGPLPTPPATPAAQYPTPPATVPAAVPPVFSAPLAPPAPTTVEFGPAGSVAPIAMPR